MKKPLVGCTVAVVAVLALLVGVFYLATLGEVSSYAKQQIRIGTPRARVLELCGPPTGERSTERFYDYDTPAALGWYAVYFDEDGLVERIDDESF